MKETGLTGKRRSTTIAATPDDGKSQRKRRGEEGCEVWSHENVDILEKVHTKFCEFMFGVSKYAYNMPVYGELGRYPL